MKKWDEKRVNIMDSPLTDLGCKGPRANKHLESTQEQLLQA